MDIMNQPYTTVLLVAFGITLLWLSWPSRHRRRAHSQHSSNTRHKALDKLRTGNAYWGVAIRDNNCDAARPYLGKKFTFDRVPALPLPGCKSRRCQCRYQGLVERRRSQRRSGTDQRRTVRLDASHPDRRSGRDRRRSAIAWKDPASHVSSLSAGLE
jgi:hypothetical protein